MSKLILTTLSSIAEVILHHGPTELVRTIPNHDLLMARLNLRDLVPIAWRNRDLGIVTTKIHRVLAGQAAKLLFVPQQKIDAAQGDSRCSRRFADSGDFVVLLPIVGAGNDLAGDDAERCRKHLSTTPVTIAFIGAKLPAEVAAVFKHVHWKHVTIGRTSLAEKMAQLPDEEVSIFDAINLGFCIPGVESFQKRYFPGRVKVRLIDLVPHLDDIHVQFLVRRKLGYWETDDSCWLEAAVHRAFIEF